MRQEECSGDWSDYLKMHASKLLSVLCDSSRNSSVLRGQHCHDNELCWETETRPLTFICSDGCFWRSTLLNVAIKNSLYCICLSPVIMRSAVVRLTASTTSWAWQEIWASSRVSSNASASPETWTPLREDWMLCCKLLCARCATKTKHQICFRWLEFLQ